MTPGISNGPRGLLNFLKRDSSKKSDITKTLPTKQMVGPPVVPDLKAPPKSFTVKCSDDKMPILSKEKAIFIRKIKDEVHIGQNGNLSESCLLQIFSLVNDQFYNLQEDNAYKPDNLLFSPQTAEAERIKILNELLEHIVSPFRNNPIAEQQVKEFYTICLDCRSLSQSEFLAKYSGEKLEIFERIKIQFAEIGKFFGTDLEKIETVHDLIAKLCEKNAPSLFENRNFYDYFSKNVEATNKLLHLWYGEDKIAPLKTILSNTIKEVNADLDYSSYFALLLHPGILNYNKEFFIFLKEYLKNPSNSRDSGEIVQAFSDYLRNATYFRGMVLIVDEVEEIKSKGIVSLGVLHKEMKTNLTNLLQPFQGGTLMHLTLPEHFEARVSNKNEKDTKYNKCLLISITGYEDIAKTAGQLFSHKVDKNGKIKDPNRKLYIFELELPKLEIFASLTDVYRFKSFCSNLSEVQEATTGKDLDINRTLIKGNGFSIPISDPGIEKFCMNVPPSRIRSIKPMNPSETYSWKIESETE